MRKEFTHTILSFDIEDLRKDKELEFLNRIKKVVNLEDYFVINEDGEAVDYKKDLQVEIDFKLDSDNLLDYSARVYSEDLKNEVLVCDLIKGDILENIYEVKA